MTADPSEQNDTPIRFEFELTGAGWARVRFEFGQHTFREDGIGYITDALGDLVRSALIIATGARTAVVRFDGEPVETRLVLGPYWMGDRWSGFRFRVLKFADFFADEADEKCDLAFEAECEPEAVCAAICEGSQRVWDALGPTGYHWLNYPFPLRALRALQLALATEEAQLAPEEPGETIVIFGGKG